jgi:predicted GIY-YIG superfamily endonuclease
MPRKTNVYILRLLAGKYYVGTSVNPTKRIKDHFAGRGAGWTKQYKPIGVEAVLNGVDVFTEDMMTKHMMAEKGIDNVRGAFYVRNEIPEPEQKMIQREIWSANSVCMRCGRAGHFAHACEHIRDIEGRFITSWQKCVHCGSWKDEVSSDKNHNLK